MKKKKTRKKTHGPNCLHQFIRLTQKKMAQEQSTDKNPWVLTNKKQ